MKVDVQEISPIKKKLSIEVSHEEYLAELEEAYQKLGKRVTVKGFRKGKIPRAILERYYKQDTESQVYTHLIEHGYVWALQDQKIDPVGPPRISDLKKDDNQPLTFVAEVEIKPKVTVSKYKGISVKKPPVEVAEEELGKELEALRQAHAQITPLPEETAVQKGQIAIVDFVGKIDGQPFEGGSGQGAMLEVGMGRFLKDFEEGLLGMKKGEKKTVPVHFPKDYPSPELAGKKAEFEITLNDLKEKVLPELNDDFARDLGNFESLEQVRAQITEHMTRQKEQVARGEMYQQILDVLIAEHPFEVPAVLVEQELDAMLENTKRHLQQQRLTLEQAGLSPEEFRNRNRELALRRVKAFFLFDAIAHAEAIQITAEEMKGRIEEIAKNMGQPPEAVAAYYQRQQMLPMIQNQIMEEKILDFLIAEAKVK